MRAVQTFVSNISRFYFLFITSMKIVVQFLILNHLADLHNQSIVVYVLIMAIDYRHLHLILVQQWSNYHWSFVIVEHKAEPMSHRLFRLNTIDKLSLQYAHLVVVNRIICIVGGIIPLLFAIIEDNCRNPLNNQIVLIVSLVLLCNRCTISS